MFNGFFANWGLTIFADLLDIFLVCFLVGDFFTFAFLAEFFETDLADFFVELFTFLDVDFLNNLRIATIPPKGGKIMACPK